MKSTAINYYRIDEKGIDRIPLPESAKLYQLNNSVVRSRVRSRGIRPGDDLTPALFPLKNTGRSHTYYATIDGVTKPLMQWWREGKSKASYTRMIVWIREWGLTPEEAVEREPCMHRPRVKRQKRKQRDLGVPSVTLFDINPGLARFLHRPRNLMQVQQNYDRRITADQLRQYGLKGLIRQVEDSFPVQYQVNL